MVKNVRCIVYVWSQWWYK